MFECCFKPIINSLLVVLLVTFSTYVKSSSTKTEALRKLEYARYSTKVAFKERNSAFNEATKQLLDSGNKELVANAIYSKCKFLFDYEKTAEFNKCTQDFKQFIALNSNLVYGDFFVRLLEIYQLYLAKDFESVVKNSAQQLDIIKKTSKLSKENRPRIFELEIGLENKADLEFISGLSNYKLASYEKAQVSFQTALFDYQIVNSDDGKVKAHQGLAMIAWSQNDYQRAISYIQEAIVLADQKDLNFQKAKLLVNKGIYLRYQKRYEESNSVLKIALKNSFIGEHPASKLNALMSLGYNARDNNDSTLAAEYAKQVIETSRSANDDDFLNRAKLFYADNLSEQKKYKESEQLALEVARYYEQKKEKRVLVIIYNGLSQVYADMNNYRKALEYKTKAMSLSYELQNEQRQKSITALQEEFESEIKTREIQLLTNKNQMQNLALKSAKNKQYLIVVFLVSLFVIITLLTFLYINRRKTRFLKEFNRQISLREEKLVLLSSAFKNTTDAVWIVNKDFVVEEVNEAFCHLTLKTRSSVIGKALNIAAVSGQGENLAGRLLDIAKSEGGWSGELYDERSDGVVYPIELEVESIKDEQGALTHYLGVFRDITLKKKHQEQLEKLATYDDLTELPNRTLFTEILQSYCNKSSLDDSIVAVFYISVDNFKKVNDSFGHDVGDEVLKEISSRLNASLNEKDTLCRFGNDEFCAMVEFPRLSLSSTKVANNLLSCFETSFHILDFKIKLTASVGIAVYPFDGKSASELLRASGIAVYEAKNERRNRFCFFKYNMNDLLVMQLKQEQMVVDALDNDLFDFYYQPIVNIKTQEVTGAEALIRLKLNDGKVIPPSEFIPLAESVGIIERIDKLVIEKVFAQIAKWRSTSCEVKNVAINLSANIFSKQTLLCKLLQCALDKYEINASNVKIEITERMLVDDIEQSIGTMEILKTMGFDLALDDFGTGFSSLSYIKQFPIDILKIDRSFIQDMNNSTKDTSIVLSIIDLAHNLGLSVIAEGVETQAQLSTLKKFKCEEFQGYLKSRPVSVAEFEIMIQENELESARNIV